MKRMIPKPALSVRLPVLRCGCLLAVLLLVVFRPAYAGVIDYANGIVIRHGAAEPFPVPLPERDIIEDAKPPLVIDWEEMEAVNPDIIGYLYVDGMPVISYPILYSGENDFYLHHNMYGEEEFRGSIFLEGFNRPDFADPNCLLYGHNMADGSMFGSLKYLNSQALYEEHPYFWILTPAGNYRYKIFAMFNTDVHSDVFLVYPRHGQRFKAWEEQWQQKSDVKNDVPLTKLDYTVCMTTCTSDPSMRFAVFGKCVSSQKPVRQRNTARFTEILTKLKENESEASSS